MAQGMADALIAGSPRINKMRVDIKLIVGMIHGFLTKDTRLEWEMLLENGGVRQRTFNVLCDGARWDFKLITFRFRLPTELEIICVLPAARLLISSDGVVADVQNKHVKAVWETLNQLVEGICDKFPTAQGEWEHLLRAGGWKGDITRK